jgi:uncharacterized membrane protein
MEADQLLLWLHIVGAAVLFGTGAGIAFFMLLAHRSHDAALVAHVAGTVVIAEFLFTATAVLLQPVTGGALAWLRGWSFGEGWLLLSLGLYAVAGLFWLPVVRIQIEMRDLAREAAREGAPLPPGYHRLFRRWFWSGWPAFAAVLAIYWLMIARPDLGRW